jgi:hypothetical protein
MHWEVLLSFINITPELLIQHRKCNPPEYKSSVPYTRIDTQSKVANPMPVLGAQGHGLHPLLAHQHKHQKIVGCTCIFKINYQNSNPPTSTEEIYLQ